jgi:hypothetical protein
LCSLPDDIPLELSERSEDMEDEFASRRGGIDRFGDRFEADLPVVEACDRLDEVLEGPAEPVKAPYDQGVASKNVRKLLSFSSMRNKFYNFNRL